MSSAGDAGMVFQDCPQPLRERRDLPGPVEGVIGLAVDLGQHAVEDEVVELLLAADVAVQRAGNHAQAGGQGAHAEGLHAVRADDREGLGDDALAGERAPAALLAVGRAEPQRVRRRITRCLRLVRHVCLR